MSARALALSLLAGGCTLVTGLPSVMPEESAAACANGDDDDLDGSVDCADDSCRAFCWDGTLIEAPDVGGCLVDEALGFRVVAADGRHQRCEPDPDTVPTCAEGEHRAPGVAVCSAPGSPCPAGEWPVAPDDGALSVHVRLSAIDGDGSAAAPFGTIAEALAATPAASRVLLARGTHEVPDRIDRAIELRGACAAETEVRGGLRVEGGGVALVDLRIAADDGPALEVLAPTEGDGLTIDGEVVVEGATLRLTDSHVEGAAGYAITAQAGARLELVASTIAGEAGVQLDGSVLMVSASAIRATRTTALRLGAGATTDSAVGLVVEPAEGIGIDLACDTGDQRCADFDLLVVRFPAGLPTGGRGVVARSGRVRLRRAYLARSLDSGLDVDGARVELENSTIEAAEAGGGVHVREGGELIAQRVFMRNNRPRAWVVDRGGLITGIDVDLLGSDRLASGDICIEALEGSSLQINRFVLESCGVCGIRIEREVELVLRDGLVAGSTRGACIGRGGEYSVRELASSVSYRENSTDLYSE